MDSEWFRWAAGLVTVTLSALIGFLVKDGQRLRDVVETNRRNAEVALRQYEASARLEFEKQCDRQRREMEMVAERIEIRIGRFEVKQDEFRKSIDEDRRIASNDRANIMSTMLSRAEFSRELDRRGFGSRRGHHEPDDE